MARSFLGGEFAGGESAWWRGDWIPLKSYLIITVNLNVYGHLKNVGFNTSLHLRNTPGITVASEKKLTRLSNRNKLQHY